MKHVKNKYLQVIMTGFLIITIACSNENFEDIHPNAFNPQAPCDTAGMTYNNDMKPLFIASCGADRTLCHKAPNTQDINLDNFFDARDIAMSGDMMGSILHQSGLTPMPDGGGFLDQCSINKIQNWIQSGYPE
jgi:hypothetical protein